MISLICFTASDKACENSLNHLDPVLAQVAELQSGTAVYVLKPSFYQQVKVLYFEDVELAVMCSTG